MEDWDFWLSLAEKGLFGRLVPEPLLYYRQHEDGGRNAPSRAIAHMTVRQIMLKHPTLFPPWYLAMDRVEKMAENVLPSLLKIVLRMIGSPNVFHLGLRVNSRALTVVMESSIAGGFSER
jgi:hypothetical protein